MARETMSLVLCAGAGGALGLVFYGGLWWTVLKGVSLSGRPGHGPALWFLGSGCLRTAIAVAGLYLVSRGDCRRLVSCFAGFLAARVIVTRLTASSTVEGEPCV